MSGKTVCMATSIDAQLATDTARDGVDTRTKDNSAATEVALEETTCLEDGDQVVVGQTAACCQGCLEDQPNQLAHMGFGGCLYEEHTGTFIAEEDFGTCIRCQAEPRIGEYTELCADCYWIEDAELKHERRLLRQNALPPSSDN